MLKIRKSEKNFIFVGTIGFFVDIAVFYELNSLLGFLCSRIISFSVSTLICWLLNRVVTFRVARSKKINSEGLSYYAVASFSAVINIWMSYFLGRFPDLFDVNFAIAVACVVAAVFNFVGLKMFVYKDGII